MRYTLQHSVAPALVGCLVKCFVAKLLVRHYARIALTVDKGRNFINRALQCDLIYGQCLPIAWRLHGYALVVCCPW